MGIKDLLVYADNSSEVGARFEVGARVAQTHGAHLTGLFVITPPYIPVYAEAQIPMEILQQQQEIAQDNAAKVEKIFTDVTKKYEISAEWRTDEGDLLTTVNTHARYFDLVILPQDNPDESDLVPAGIADKALLDCGRPILVIPYIGAPEVIGERVLIAWNARREAARAINDALPLIMNAKEAKVLSIDPKSGPNGHGDIPGADICLHLARHGISAEARQTVSKEVNVGDAILSAAADDGADLIVMGGYGHARIREVVLGGATRHILKHMTVPVLMSH